MQNSLTLDWADGSYNFRLPWAACATVEKVAGAPIREVFLRFGTDRAGLSEVAEIIRQGLLCGDGGTVDGQRVETKPDVVQRLLDRYVTGPEARPFLESEAVAWKILQGFMVGYEPAQAEGSKKKTGEEPVTSRSI
ncbi:MAG: gene transfer agent family protein [Pseudomonadota bacterium]|nr:gene transfer agent family protein [Pseudomonadota bacterium]